MTLTKLNQSRDMFPRHFSQLFDSIFENGNAERSPSFFQPRTDVIEKDDRFEVQVSLPGLKKEEIKIDLKNNQLMISGERKLNREEKNTRFHLVENSYGSFSRTFNLPETVKREAIDARFEDGILVLILPKKEEAAPTSIQVK